VDADVVAGGSGGRRAVYVKRRAAAAGSGRVAVGSSVWFPHTRLP